MRFCLIIAENRHFVRQKTAKIAENTDKSYRNPTSLNFTFSFQVYLVLKLQVSTVLIFTDLTGLNF
jgi:hypothetical protein